ncbi:MAG: ABC transporter substrate-binding protein [Paludibacteraceae bacterium]|nr:ABC transporter substrate-binding protein [Paludibacteraceae bacterium]
MKKGYLLFFLLLSATFGFQSSNAVAADRAHTLKVYNWQDYIDMDNVLNKFPDWYKEQTGEDVVINYQTFDINENMLTQIEMGHEDYDVICPSEYIIERMLRNNLLLPIDKNFGSTPDYTKLVAPFAVDKFQQMAPDSTYTVSDYTVGYMWGTTGILYNADLVDGSQLNSWGCLQNPEFKNRILMKDAFRDVYSVVVLYCYKDEIAAGTETRDDLVARVTPERIKRVEDFLIGMKENIAGWEVDFGKEEMTKGKTWMDLIWSGDAQWAIDEAPEDVHLEYIIPEEGSNVWFDGWCIPKYAQNTKAASYFINYMCMPENAILNMEEIGYVSVIADSTILAWANDEDIEETADLTYFFGEGADSIHANQVFYPDLSIINRCALMHDCNEHTEDMLNMWNHVKGDNLNKTMLIILGCILSLIAVGIIVRMVVKRRKQSKQNKHHKNKK